MTRVTVSRTIAAPVEVVFEAVTNIERLAETSPDVVGVEFLTASHHGLGTRFRETRKMKDREMVTELEITEFVENERSRMVADSHGTVWDTLFTVRPENGKTLLEIEMDARPHRLLTKLMTPLMKGFFRKGIEKHIEDVRDYCERIAAG